VEKGGEKAGCGPLGRNTKIHALADAKGRLIAILLTEAKLTIARSQSA
jgi:hypothetical protein